MIEENYILYLFIFFQKEALILKMKSIMELFTDINKGF